MSLHNNGHITARLLLTDEHTKDGFVVPLKKEDGHLATNLSSHYMKCNRDIQEKNPLLCFQDMHSTSLVLLTEPVIPR